jgi:hypothetical protein
MILRSENLNELAAALSKAQGEFPLIAKNKKVDFQPKTGGRVKYNYADLADVISAISPVLARHGLSFIQETQIDGENLILESTLMHASGQWRTNRFPLAKFDRQQEQGSELTYIRRYTLTAMLGVHADEDDDGQSASEKTKLKEIKNDEPRSFSARPQPTANQSFNNFNNKGNS